MPARPTDGFLLVDKPVGVTSQDAVTTVRRALGAERAGHTGTLDPFATGLLIVLLGRATRLARYAPAAPKIYDADIRFGTETETDDRTGVHTSSAEPPDESRVREAMSRLTGTIAQVPPAYSAKQVGGRRAYAMARAGEAVTLEPVNVHVQRWDVLSYDRDMWRVRITCGSGTYIRALARDLGRLASSAAHLGALRRVRIGPFDVAEAMNVERVRKGVTPRPVADLLPDLPQVRLDAQGVGHVRTGRDILADVTGARAALLDESGELIAVAERQGESWHPSVVLTTD
jgi:tRNA pseudouridine55 synthase